MNKKTSIIRCHYCDNHFTIEEKAVYIDNRHKRHDYEYVRCPECLSTRNSTYDTREKKIISPATTTPFKVTEGVVSGGNVPPITDRVMLVDNRPRIAAWHCRSTEQKTGKSCIARVSPEAIIQPEFGWCCDFCCRWTFGDDDTHQPLKGGRHK